ncbi:hypothetical protein FHX74_002166 [Friedmanniella endophytica]|uniref:DUF4307 domain-containing protein n=1 Tax=Microlunatus kandeliicorticis TaxID=1759536 RepID=A0A7W3P640_9ACTN|nr:DUF4307 domain-containing protein [Microlunatus kandeliicorticis]MBA8794547.1 hypothetical protein [Microlunatus kandeliicorticis]
MPDSTAQAERARIAAKLAARYPPPRFPKAALVGLVAVLAAGFLTWLVWAAWLHAEPAVTAQVSAFAFPSDTRADVTVTVQRRDPAEPASCRVIVQATNFENVGEIDVVVPAGTDKLVDAKETIRTLRRGTSASVSSCRLIG